MVTITSPPVVPAAHTSEGREQVAWREIGHTTVRPAVAWASALAFVLLVLAVPVAQHSAELGGHADGQRASWWPHAYDVLAVPAIGARALIGANGSSLDRLLAGNRAMAAAITSYQDELEETSILGRAVRLRAQTVLTSRLGVGNEKAYLGRGGWIFYRPDLDYLTGPGFLEPARLAARSREQRKGGGAVEPDPRLAILDFARQLHGRGIHLMLVVAPSKAAVHPERFSAAYRAGDAPVRNPSFGVLLRDLQHRGVEVIDLAPALCEAVRRTARPQYLATDTHWTPEGMATAARRVADALRKHLSPASGDPGLVQRSRSVSNHGDLTLMLALPTGQTAIPRETVTINEVIDCDSALLKPARDAQVLLLGDSFANIYSLAALGWGEGAGLAEQLAFELGRPVDALLRNDDGAHATRAQLARELAAGRDRLAGKQVVVWELAEREFAFGDFAMVDLPAASVTAGHAIASAGPAGDRRLVQVRVAELAEVPKPGSVPYRDHIVAVRLVEVASAAQLVVYMWGMRDNVLTAAARYQTGEIVTLTLSPWSAVSADLERINRSELDDSTLALDAPAWAEPATGPTAKAASAGGSI